MQKLRLQRFKMTSDIRITGVNSTRGDIVILAANKK